MVPIRSTHILEPLRLWYADLMKLVKPNELLEQRKKQRKEKPWKRRPGEGREKSGERWNSNWES